MSAQLVTLVAALIAAIASGIGAFFSFRSSRMQAPQKIAEFRLAWIEDLRKDVASLIAFATIKNRSDEQVREMHEIQARIFMRLNLDEDRHIKLKESIVELIAFMTGRKSGNILDAANQTILICQEVFKFEWRRIKYEVIKGKLSKEK